MPTHGFKIHFLIYRSRSLQPMKHCVIHLLEEVYMFSTHIIKSLIIIGSTWSRWDDRKFCCRHEYFRLKKLLNGGPKAWLLHPLPTRPLFPFPNIISLFFSLLHIIYSPSFPLLSRLSRAFNPVRLSFPFPFYTYIHPLSPSPLIILPLGSTTKLYSFQYWQLFLWLMCNLYFLIDLRLLF